MSSKRKIDTVTQETDYKQRDIEGSRCNFLVYSQMDIKISYLIFVPTHEQGQNKDVSNEFNPTNINHITNITGS